MTTRIKATNIELLTRAADPDGRLIQRQAEKLAQCMEELRDALDNAIDTARAYAETLADSSTADERADARNAFQSDAEVLSSELEGWKP